MKLILSIVLNKLFGIPLMLVVLPDIAFVIELYHIVQLSERQSLKNFGKFQNCAIMFTTLLDVEWLVTNIKSRFHEI